MKKFFNFSKITGQRGLEINSDQRLGLHSEIQISDDFEVYVRADLLSLAGLGFPPEDYLQTLKEFCAGVNAKGIHAKFSVLEHDGIWFFTPAPFIPSQRLWPSSVEKIQRLQDVLKLPIKIQNHFVEAEIPTYMREADFYFEVVSRSGCGFICDIRASIQSALAKGEDVGAQTKRLLELSEGHALAWTADDVSAAKELNFNGRYILPQEVSISSNDIVRERM